MNCETYTSKVQEHMKNEHGIEIPWDQILDIVIDLLSDGCFDSEAEAIEGIKNPSRMQKASMRIRARRGGISRRHVASFVDCCCHCCEDCTDDDLAGMYQEVQSLFIPMLYYQGA